MKFFCIREMAKEVNDRFVQVLDHLERICELEVELGILSPLGTKGRKQSAIERLFKSLGQEAFLFQRKHSTEKAEEDKSEPIVVAEAPKVARVPIRKA
jgi:hypothetical protein